MAFDKQAAADMVKRLPTFVQDFTLDHYQDIISAADYPDPEKGPVDFDGGRYPMWYYALGLAGEAGETVDKIKKVYRNDAGVLNNDSRKALALELGDALWYLARIAAKVGFSLGQVAQMNVEKLSDRAARGVLRSSGDNR